MMTGFDSLQPDMNVYSWNVLYENDPENIRKFVAAHDFDVLCLQEVTGQMLAHLRELPYELAHEIDVVRHQPDGDTDTNYVVILSKHPIQGTGKISYPELAVPWQTRVFLALMRWGTVSRRNALYADLLIDGTLVRVYSVHLSLWTPTTRMGEFHMVAETLPKDYPAIIAGDFNVLDWWPMKLLNWLLGGPLMHAAPWYPERERMQNTFTQNDLKNVLRGQRTHKLSRSQLDHILVSNDLSVISAEVVGESYGSDHQPVMATLEL